MSFREEPPLNAKRRWWHRVLFWSAIPIIIVLIMCGLFATTNSACMSDRRDMIRAEYWYPNAELISEEHDFLDAYGIGTTIRTLTSPDNFTDVRAWYITQDRDRLGVSGPADWDITENANDDGVTITLTYQCQTHLKLW